MIKKTFLYFLFLFLVLSMPGCKKELPTSPDVEGALNPGNPSSLVIDYFNANPSSIEFNESGVNESLPRIASVMLSWGTTDATVVEIDQGVGIVPTTGTIEVSLEETTTYTLIAKYNDAQKQKSCTVKIIPSAFFDIEGSSGAEWRTDDGYYYWDFTVNNLGDATAYNVVLKSQIFNSNHVLLDTAYGYPADGGHIAIGVKVSFELIFYEIHTDEEYREIDKYTWELTWLNAN